MTGRDVGAMGEATFKRWCSSAGFTANGAQMDKTGWDFLVEFPWQQDERLPRDLLPAPVECRVQIKSTDKKQKGVSVKLSALNRLVKAPIPTFFCFIEFDGQDQEQAAYLVHVG
ncbi:MAG: DUF4365 domain-containing protein, partial [Microcoleus sp. SIO2G3]|nr:DUF4365 domain-containing protein [Microcoleus sp. SIO2G3]